MNSPTKNEAYWHNRHPVSDIVYAGRPLPGTNSRFPQDVRNFLTDRDCVIRKRMERDLGFEGYLAGDISETMLRIQRWACTARNLAYVSDTTLGCPEYWMYAAETLERRRGDCDDGANLMATMALIAMPPEHHWRIRVTCGHVEHGDTKGGHAWLTFCRPQDNEFVVCDWCFLPDPNVPICQKPLAKHATAYKEVWFSYTIEHAYSHSRVIELHGKPDDANFMRGMEAGK